MQPTQSSYKTELRFEVIITKWDMETYVGTSQKL